MKIKDLRDACRLAAHTVDCRSPARLAIEQMEHCGADALVVMRETTPLGLFTPRHGCHACVHCQMDKPVEELIDVGLIIARQDDYMLDIVNQLVQANQSVVPIIGDQPDLQLARLGQLATCLLHHMTEELESWQSYLTDLQAANID